MGLVTLKKRSEFLRLRGGARWANAAFILETRPQPGEPQQVLAKRTASFGLGANPKRADLCDSADVGKAHGLRQDSSSTKAAQSAKLARQPRFGFTVTKRIGNAVTRNLVRRRLKEAIRSLAAAYARPDHDYVIIAKSAILACAYEQLTRDLKTALERVHQARPKRSGPSRRRKASHSKEQGRRKNQQGH